MLFTSYDTYGCATETCDAVAGGASCVNSTLL